MSENKNNKIVIGVPKEVKTKEGRVGLTPRAVERILKTGKAEVLVETNVGVLSGFSDDDYMRAGALIVGDAETVFDNAKIIVKVKEITPEQFHLLHEGQVVYTFLHASANPEMVKVFKEKNILGVSYDTIRNRDNRLIVLEPMSQVAGQMSIVKALEINPDIKEVMILGCGTAGVAAIEEALGHEQVNVLAMDINNERLVELKAKYPRIRTARSSLMTILKNLKDTDLVVGAVLVPGGTAPVLIERRMLKIMKDGSIIVDISIDQGGCVATSRPTTHDNPTFTVDGVVHYCVANMPGTVPHISTPMLVKAHMPYLLQMINKGFSNEAIATWTDVLKTGINTHEGNITNERVASDLKEPFTPID